MYHLKISQPELITEVFWAFPNVKISLKVLKSNYFEVFGLNEWTLRLQILAWSFLKSNLVFCIFWIDLGPSVMCGLLLVTILLLKTVNLSFQKIPWSTSILTSCNQHWLSWTIFFVSAITRWDRCLVRVDVITIVLWLSWWTEWGTKIFRKFWINFRSIREGGGDFIATFGVNNTIIYIVDS